MKEIRYLDFDLMIDRRGEGYQARVLQSPAGQAETQFSVPVSDAELEDFVLTVGQPRRNPRAAGSTQIEQAKKLGGDLFKAVFSGQVHSTFSASIFESERQDCGLRIRLHLTSVPELSGIPWEFLYEPNRQVFLALSNNTPLIRYLHIQQAIRPLQVKSPLKVLVMISSPKGLPRLDVDREWAKLKESIKPLEERDEVTLELLEAANLTALQRQLRQNDYHIFHYIGHGGYDQEMGGVLALENDLGGSNIISAFDLGTMLHDHRSLRLVVLNSCEGGRSSQDDPFAGTAQSLVQKGIPAVIAMQFEITDQAAIRFSQEFYSAIADGYPVDASLAEARKAIIGTGNPIEWATPVLYLRSPDGKIFDKARPEPPVIIVEEGPAPQTNNPPNKDSEGEKKTTSALTLIQTYKTDLADRGICFTDRKNVLWLSDGREIKLFETRQPDPVERWYMPELRWKARLERHWQDGMVFTDWDGNLWIFNRQSGGHGRKLYSARYSDLPIHQLYADEKGYLAAASWNSKVMMWDAAGALVFAPPGPVSSYLPTAIKPCGQQAVALIDQSNNLRVIDPSGNEIWCYQAKGSLRDFWLSVGADEKIVNFFLLVDQQKIVNIKLGQSAGKEILLKSPVISYSHLVRKGEGETLLSLDENGMEWFSWNPFRVTTPSGSPRDFSAVQCFALPSPPHKANRLSLSLDRQGVLFSTDENVRHTYPRSPAKRLTLDETQRFVYLSFDDRVEVYRNPALPAVPCQATLVKVSGALSSTRYQEVHMSLKNSGNIPICDILASLSGKGEYLVSPSEARWRGNLLPGEEVDLPFSAKAREAGKLLFVLDLHMQDEAGPPIWKDQLELSLEAST